MFTNFRCPFCFNLLTTKKYINPNYVEHHPYPAPSVSVPVSPLTFGWAGGPGLFITTAEYTKFFPVLGVTYGDDEAFLQRVIDPSYRDPALETHQINLLFIYHENQLADRYRRLCE